MKRFLAVACILSTLVLSPAAYSQVPSLINYQGRLLSGTNLVSGNVGLSLRLFSVAGGGASLYEDSNTVTVVDGLYATFIGDHTVSGSLAAALTNAAVYVEVAVNGTALAPRERIASVSYALNVNASGIAGQLADSQLSTNVARLSVPNTALQATGVPTVSFGFVVNATVTFGGSGYVTPPVVTVNDGGGVGAVVVASMAGGSVTGLAVSAPGSGYSTNATLTIAPPPSNAYQTFGGVNYFTGVNSMTHVSNTFAGSFSGTFSGPGILPWQTIAGTNVQAQPNAGYLLANDALVTVTLPTSPNTGDVVRISGIGAGGWKIVQNANQSVRALNIPGNLGGIWTPRDTNRSWQRLASSADGSKLIAGAYSSNLYTSTDSGVSWTPRSSNASWNCVASSADGSKLVAGVYVGALYTSTDSGGSWSQRTFNANWYSVASSADGSKLVAAPDSLNLYTSSDSGANWTARDVMRAWRGVASSADGNKLVAVGTSWQIYTSTNSGTNWTARESTRAWQAVASSADGSKLVAVVFGGQIYTSTDSGVTWAARESSRNWYSVASSADGSKLVAGVEGGQIYISTDSGVTWAAREGSRAWRAVASSADGGKLVAAAYGDQIYTSIPNSTLGVTGYVLGSQNAAVELQYIGNGQFIPLSYVGTIIAY